MDKAPAIYILASKRNGTLYVGVTSDLIGRVSEHKQGLIDGFTKRYQVHLLVHYEIFDDMEQAIGREKQIKKWPRVRKLALIEAGNPTWRDLCWEMSGLVRGWSRVRTSRSPYIVRRHRTPGTGDHG
jgi:putative endonuclease